MGIAEDIRDELDLQYVIRVTEMDAPTRTAIKEGLWTTLGECLDLFLYGGTGEFTTWGGVAVGTVLTDPGDMLYIDALGDPTSLPVASDGMFLSIVSGLPTWVTPPGGSGPYASTPADLGVATPGVSPFFARGDHVHNMPDAADVGADPAGTAASLAGAVGTALLDLQQRVELLAQFKTALATNYTEYGYTGDNLTTVSVWEDMSKLLLLFTRTLVYSGDDLVSVTTTDVVTGATYTKTLTVVADVLTSTSGTFT